MAVCVQAATRQKWEFVEESATQGSAGRFAKLCERLPRMVDGAALQASFEVGGMFDEGCWLQDAPGVEGVPGRAEDERGLDGYGCG